ncbi:unnamed protein product [Effrenium voratum]|uniref:Uncharacterized protein n=1 Tax=Effrenium voratum TaxID=2562239 RepID=A0AA36I5X3_9DINO|nr:unnamed protein product [Effrenium voratum]CAJ1440991.1 unnamed protein product [Effrenium voratum]
MAMMRTRTKSRGMCLCLLGIALALLVQPSTDFARGVPGLKEHAKRHPLHAGVARRAGAAQEDNSAEDRLDLEEVISEAERVLNTSATKKDMQVVMRKVQLTDPGKWNDLATKPELKQQLKKFVAEAALKALEEDLLLARQQQASAQRQVETAQRQVESAQRQVESAQRQVESAQEQEAMAVRRLARAATVLETAEDSGNATKVQEAKEEVQEAERKVQEAERKVQEAKKEVQEAKKEVQEAKKEVQEAEVKEAKASGRTKESEEHVEKLVKKFAGAEYWARPTPRFGKYVRGERLTWPGTDLPCPGELPNASRTDDGRTTAFGIGNAFGTGKTEVAIRSAEMTCAAEPGLRVAYISFSNGYKSPALTDTVKDDSLREGEMGQVFRCSKYCGLWLMAGIRATRVIDNEVQGNSILFQAIVGAYMGNPQWKLPDYVEQTDAKLIVILDEVQRFSFSALEGLVTMIVVPSKTRMSLVVGAFSPSFLNPSGNRLRDVRLPVLAEDDMEQIFQDRIPGAQINFEGVSLPGLFGGCVRPLASWSSAKEELGMNQDPTQSCLRQYETSSYWTTAGLVQAAVADVPICSEMLKTAFMQDSLSLGAAFVLPKDRHFLVSLPPLQIAAGQFELPTEIDKGTQRKVRDILTGFCSPTWTQFEELTGIAPALRVAALSQSNMGLILGGHTILQHVFGSEASNTKAQELLRKNVREDLAVRWVRGGTDVAAVNFSQLSCDAGEKELLTIGMAADHNSNFDHFLIVPLDNGEKLLFCLDAKFSVEGMEKDLNFEQDIQPKLKGFSAMNLPTSWHTLVLIVSNRRITEGQAIRVQNFAEAPLIAAGAEHLQRVLSCSLVPPAYRERRRKKQS